MADPNALPVRDDFGTESSVVTVRSPGTAAALSTTHHGPATSPGLTETLSFMQSHGLTQAVPSEVMIARSDWDKPGASGRPQQGEVK